MAINAKSGDGKSISVIHINVPRDIKARWVRNSQAQGLKLTDWIIKQLESTMPKTYILTTDHAASSHGAPVFIDQHGAALGPADVGIWGLPKNYCGRVDFGDKVYWSGYSSSPAKMMDAVTQAFRDGATVADVFDAGKVVCR